MNQSSIASPTRELRPLHERLAVVRAKLLDANWAEQDARDTLERTRFQARQHIIDSAEGFDAKGVAISGIKVLGPNQESQTAAIEAALAEDELVMSCMEWVRIATREREKLELALSLLVDEERGYRSQTARMQAIADLDGRPWES